MWCCQLALQKWAVVAHCRSSHLGWAGWATSVVVWGHHRAPASWGGAASLSRAGPDCPLDPLLHLGGLEPREPTVWGCLKEGGRSPELCASSHFSQEENSLMRGAKVTLLTFHSFCLTPPLVISMGKLGNVIITENIMGLCRWGRGRLAVLEALLEGKKIRFFFLGFILFFFLFVWKLSPLQPRCHS